MLGNWFGVQTGFTLHQSVDMDVSIRYNIIDSMIKVTSDSEVCLTLKPGSHREDCERLQPKDTNRF